MGCVQYTNITEERPLAPPDVAWLQSLTNVQQGASDTPADWFNALTVGVSYCSSNTCS